jgi:Zn ribbon nucleic-acid-binding protein
MGKHNIDNDIDDEEEEYEYIYEIYNNSPIGKIRKRTDKLCPSCEESDLYIVVYEKESENVIYAQEFYECLECGYKESKKNKSGNHKDIDFDDLY